MSPWRSGHWHLKWLWYKHMWPILWVHKPLCAGFSRDRLKVGSLHLCRSCAALWSGLLVTALLAAALAVEGLPPGLLPALLLLLLAPVFFYSHPLVYAGLSRRARDGIRFGAGALLGLILVAFLSGALLLGTLALALVLGARQLYQKVRRARAVDPCRGCSELGSSRVCTGYEPQARCFRAYEEAAALLLMRTAPPTLAAQAARAAGRTRKRL